MTSKEFTIWLKGFITACNEYSPTPKQWDIIKEELEKVDKFVETPGMFQVHPEKPYPGTPIGQGGWGTPNHDLVERYPWGGQKVWAGEPIDCSKSGTTITTTPGVTGHISIANPNLVSFSSGSSSTAVYNPNIGNWSYTNGTYVNPYKPFSSGPDKPKKKKKNWEDEIELGGSE